MRRIVFICMLLCMLVGAANGQVSRAWVKRTVVPNSGNNTLVATQRFSSQAGEFVYTLSSVTMLDGTVAFQVVKRRSSGTDAWSRTVTRTTGRHRVYAKDLQLDAEGNVVVLAEVKDKADYDVVVYRFNADGTMGPTTTISDKWVDDSFMLHPADERAIGLAVRGTGEAIVLASEFGNPNAGLFPRIREVSTDGEVVWNTFFRQSLAIQYNPPINNPIAIALDSSGQTVLLVQTARIIQVNANTQVDTRENLTVARFGTDGQLRSEMSFGAAVTSGNTSIELSDVPVALSVDASGNANVVGTAVIEPWMGLAPFPFQIQETIQFGQAGVNWTSLQAQTDQFGRFGNFLPRKVMTRTDGVVVTIGSEQAFEQLPVANIRGYNGGTLVFNRKGDQGFFNAITFDTNNNMYVTGARRVKVGKNFEQTGITSMFTTTAAPIWTYNQVGGFVDKDGTEGRAIIVNSALDIYVGMNERWQDTTSGKIYDTAGTFKLIQDPKAISMSVTPGSVVGGDTFKLTVTLDKKAPAGGFAINVTPDHSSVVNPGPLTVPAGKDVATFTINTNAVGSQRTVNLTAQPGNVMTSITLKTGWLTTLTLSTNEVQGGTSLVGTIKLNAPAPGGGARVNVSATSSNVILPQQGFVTVPSGQTTVTFPIGTRAVGAVTETFVAITYNSTARQQLFLNPPQVNSIVAPATIASGGYTDVTITLTGKAPSAGLPVQIVTDSEALAGMTVVVPANATSLKFRMNASAVAADIPVGLTAKTSTETVKTLVTVLAPQITSVLVNPTDVTGGLNSTFTVKLTGIAPAGGVVINLASSSTAVVMPASMTILAGKNTGKITLRTNSVSSTVHATLSASLKGTTKQGTLVITPAN